MCLLDWNGNWLFIIEGVGVACGDWRVVVVSGSRSFDDVGSYTVHPKGLDMSNAIFDGSSQCRVGSEAAGLE